MKKTAIFAAMVLTLGISSAALAAGNGHATRMMAANDQPGMEQSAPAKAPKKEMKKVKQGTSTKAKAGHKKNAAPKKAPVDHADPMDAPGN